MRLICLGGRVGFFTKDFCPEEVAFTTSWAATLAFLNVPTSRAVSCIDLRVSNVSKPNIPKVSATTSETTHIHTGPENPCMGAIARTDANGLELKPGKQYNAGSIHVVDCNKDVSPQYRLTSWKGT